MRCAIKAPPIVGDARWKPAITGAIRAVQVRGEPRLSVDDHSMLAWSPDGAMIAVADRKAIGIWRARDGALLDLLPYGERDALVARIVWSRDGRWIAATASSPGGNGEAPVTLLVDRAAADAAVLHVLDSAAIDRGGYRATATRVLAPPPLAGRGVTVRVTAKHDAVELVDASGAARRLSSYDDQSALALVDGGARLEIARPGELTIYALPAGTVVRKLPLSDTDVVMLSPDGRRVAGWTLSRVRFSGGIEAEPPPPQPRPLTFLAMWDVASGALLWNDTTRCCETWDFSADGQWLVPPWHRLGSEAIATATGRVVTFPGRLMSVSPDGVHAVIGTRDGLELWTTAGKPALALAHSELVLARGPGGAVVAELAAVRPLGRGILTYLGTGAIVLAVGDRCTTLFPDQETRGDHAFAFSPDGSQLYTARWSAAGTDAAIVRVEDGVPVHAIRAHEGHYVIPAPALGRFVFAVRGGARVVDATTGREVASAPSPRVTYSRGSGLVWDVRDPDGERTSRFGALVAYADGVRLAGATQLREEVITLWDLEDVLRTVDLPVSGVNSALAVSPDGAHVVAGDRDGRVVAFTGPAHTSRDLPPSRGWIRALAFSPDSKLLAIGSDDGTIQLLDIATGSSVGTATLVADRPLLLTWVDAHTLVVDSSRRLAFELTLGAP
jgi:WD40 repeat protein